MIYFNNFIEEYDLLKEKIDNQFQKFYLRAGTYLEVRSKNLRMNYLFI